MRDYYVYFITAYESENVEMGNFLRAVGLEIVLPVLDEKAALAKAMEMAPSKPYFYITRVVHRCPALEEQGQIAAAAYATGWGETRVTDELPAPESRPRLLEQRG